jgi:hypothetical protein
MSRRRRLLIHGGRHSDDEALYLLVLSSMYMAHFRLRYNAGSLWLVIVVTTYVQPHTCIYVARLGRFAYLPRGTCVEVRWKQPAQSSTNALSYAYRLHTSSHIRLARQQQRWQHHSPKQKLRCATWHSVKLTCTNADMSHTIPQLLSIFSRTTGIGRKTVGFLLRGRERKTIHRERNNPQQAACAEPRYLLYNVVYQLMMEKAREGRGCDGFCTCEGAWTPRL